MKIDDGYHRNPKVRAAGLHARALHLAGLCWTSANLHDGRIPRAMLALIAAEAEVKPSVVKRLVEVGLWHETPDGWEIHDYLEFNRSAAQIQADREAAKRRQQKGRQSQALSRRDDDRDERRDFGGGAYGGPDPTRPVPLTSNPTTNPESVAPNPAGGGGVDGYAEALRLAVDAEQAAERNPIGNPAAWRKTVRERLERAHGPAIRAALAAGQTPAQAATVTRPAPATRVSPLAAVWSKQ